MAPWAQRGRPRDRRRPALGAHLRHRPVLLVLIGSDVAAMERLTSHDRPLYGRAGYGRSIRRAVWRASTSKSVPACSTGMSARMATAPMRQSISLRAVSPPPRQAR